jgi:hypothetical protein
MINISMEVAGLKEALKEIQSLDKSLRRQITRDYKQIMAPTVRDATNAIKDIPDVPMSGWARDWDPFNRGNDNSRYIQDRRYFRQGRFTKSVKRRLSQGETFQGVLPWDTGAASKMVRSTINTKAVKQYAGRDVNLAVFSVKLLGVANTIFATAGRSSGGSTEAGQRMIQVLKQRFGAPVRILWPAYLKNQDQVERDMKQLVDKIAKASNRRLQAEE